MIPPQIPIWSYVGTNPTAVVAKPMHSNVMMSVALRPMRSP
jgi:hypothetical protein